MIADNLPITEVVMLLDKAVVKGFKRGISDRFQLNWREFGEFSL